MYQGKVVIFKEGCDCAVPAVAKMEMSQSANGLQISQQFLGHQVHAFEAF